MNKILVVGGAGMIGRRVVAHLQNIGAEVAVYDNLSSGLPMPNGIDRATVADVRNIDILSQAFRSFRPDSVIHLAAVHHIPTCEIQRSYALDVNIVGTENVMCASEQANVSNIVIASSGAVYDWENGALEEDTNSLFACDSYALAKTTNESQLRFFTQRSGMRGRVARIFNTIAFDDPNAHLIPDIVSQIDQSNRKTVLTLGNTAPLRDYIHATDVARGLIALALDPRSDVGYDTFNICSGNERSVLQVVESIGKILGVDIEVKIDENRKRKIDRNQQLGSTKKMASILNWHAELKFEEALQSTIVADKNDIGFE